MSERAAATGLLRRLLTQLAAMAAVALGAWLIASAAAENAPRGAAMALVTLVVGSMMAVSLFRWQWGLFVFLAWLVCEDLARKLLDNNLLIYFAKDLIILALYVGFLLRSRLNPVPRLRGVFMVPLLAFAAICIGQVLNPYSPSPLYGLLGLRLYLFYVPLAFIGFAVLDSTERLRTFLLVNLALAMAVATVGLMQGTVAPQLLNPSVQPEGLDLLNLSRQSPLTGYLLGRPSSVFVSTGRFALYLIVMLCLALGATLSASQGQRGGPTIGVLSLMVIGPAIIITGSRGAFLFGASSVAAISGWALLKAKGSPGRLRLTRVIAGMLAVLGLAIACSGLLFPEAMTARWALYYETLAPWSPATELAYRASDYPVGEFLAALRGPHPLLGNGTGTASLGGQYLGSVFGVAASSVRVESGPGTLLAEMGLLGLIAWVTLVLSILAEAWRSVRRLRGSPLHPLAAAMAWYVFLVLVPFVYGGIAAYQDFVTNAWLWLLLGMLLRLPYLASVPAGGREPYGADHAAP